MITVWFNTFKWCQSITFLVTLAMYSCCLKRQHCVAVVVILLLVYISLTIHTILCLTEWLRGGTIAVLARLNIVGYLFCCSIFMGYISQKSVKDYSCMWILFIGLYYFCTSLKSSEHRHLICRPQAMLACQMCPGCWETLSSVTSQWLQANEMTKTHWTTMALVTGMHCIFFHPNIGPTYFQTNNHTYFPSKTYVLWWHRLHVI